MLPSKEEGRLLLSHLDGLGRWLCEAGRQASVIGQSRRMRLGLSFLPRQISEVLLVTSMVAESKRPVFAQGFSLALLDVGALPKIGGTRNSRGRSCDKALRLPVLDRTTPEKPLALVILRHRFAGR